MADFTDIIKGAGLGLEAAGLFTQSRAVSRNLDANARIAGFNAAEQERLLPLNIEAIRSDIASVQESFGFEQRRLTEEVRRERRQEGISTAGIGAELLTTGISREEVEARSGITTQLLGRTIDSITLAADEQIRQLQLRERDRIAEVSVGAAGAGVSITSGSIAAVREDIEEDIQAQVDVTGTEADIRRAEATLRNTLELSTARERLAVLDRQIGDLDLQQKQVEFILEDALFDAAIEEEINIRNRDIAIERLEREEEIVRRQAEIGIESAREREAFLEEEQDRQLIGDLLSAGSFGVEVLDKFPTLAKSLGNLLGFESAAGGLETAIDQAVTETIIGSSGAGAKGGAASDLLGTGSSAVSQFVGGVKSTLGLPGAAPLTGAGGLTTAFAAPTSLSAGTLGSSFAFAETTSAATAAGVVALPVAAMFAIAALGGAFSGPGNTPAAMEKATSKVTDILTTANPTEAQLERAKALLGLPNNFSDPNPGTISNFGGVENRINALGGIDRLSPAAREVFQLALDKRTEERAIREQGAAQSLGVGSQDFVGTRAGQLIQQGYTAVQTEELLRNVIGSGS